MEIKDWITLIGILTTLIISGVTLIINFRREKVERGKKAQEDLEKRVYTPHIEFEINANFYGPEAGAYIAEFLFVARNKGNVQQKFNDIRIRVRGIDDGQGFQFWEGNEPRLNFPRRLVKQKSILPDDYSFFFVEPGIEQVFTYITKIPINTKYLLVHAEFEYDKYTPHTTERVFEVKVLDS